MDDDEPDSATQAFDALRRELGIGLVTIERALGRITRQNAERGDGGRDTLAAMAEQLAKTHGLVAGIAASPALQPRPTELRSHSRLISAAEQAAIHRLEQLYGRMRSVRDQRRWVIAALTVGAGLGGLLGIFGPNSVAAIAPARWHWPERLAANVLHLDMAQAGMRMVVAADPALARIVMVGLDNRIAIDACQHDADRVRHRVRCSMPIEPGM